MFQSHGQLRRVTVVFLMLFSLTTFLPLAASAQGNSDAAQSCQGEGYLNYTDAGGNAFTSVGQCISYAAQGTALVPVVVTEPGGGTDPVPVVVTDPGVGTDPGPVVGAFISVVATKTGADGGDLVIRGSGLLPGSTITQRLYFAIESRPGPGDFHRDFEYGVVDASGNFSRDTKFACNVTYLSVSIIGLAADGTTWVSGSADLPC